MRTAAPPGHTQAVETLGTGLVLPFGFIYLHEVRGFSIETAGTLLAAPAIVAMAVVGPAGALIDRLGARGIILAGMLILGCAAMALIAVAVEHRIPARANGVSARAADLSLV